MGEIGMLVRYGGIIPGREKEAISLFEETQKLYGAKLAEGVFTYYEPFMFRTGDLQDELGFFIVKGPEDKVLEFFESKESLKLRDKVSLIVNHLHFEFLFVGTDILEQVAIMNEVVEEKIPVGV